MSNLIGKIQGTVKEGKSCIKLNSDIVDINGLEITSDGIFGGFTKGMVVQVKHKDYKKTVKKDSTGWTAIDNNLETGFVVAIKPSSSTSNVFISCNLHVSINIYDTPGQHYWGARLYRKIGNGDWTHVSEATGEETNGTPIWLTDSSHENDDNMRFRLINLGNSFLDSPGTTEIVYYTIYWANIYQDTDTNQDLLYLNRSTDDSAHSSSSWNALPISNITAKEIWNSGTVYRPDNNLITLDQSDNNVDISGTLNVQGEKVMTVPALDICGNDLSANTTYEITTGPPGSINNISFVKKYFVSGHNPSRVNGTGTLSLPNDSIRRLEGWTVLSASNSTDFTPLTGVWVCPTTAVYFLSFEPSFTGDNMIFRATSRITVDGADIRIVEFNVGFPEDDDDVKQICLPCSVMRTIQAGESVIFRVHAQSRNGNSSTIQISGDTSAFSILRVS